MRRGLFTLFVVIVLAGVGAPPVALPVWAQSILSGGTIEEIRVEGTQRIEPATVRSYMLVNPGQPLMRNDWTGR